MIRNPSPSDPLNFKFRWMDAGNITGGAALAGSFDGRQLTLADHSWNLEQLSRCDCDEAVLSAAVIDDEQWLSLVIVVVDMPAETLRRILNSVRSQQALAAEQVKLIEQGQGESFRSEVCPHCEASISLSRFADSPQGFCNYCQTLFTFGNERGQGNFRGDEEILPAELEPKYRLCDHCEMYSYPKKFRIFYFVFLVYHMHFSSDTTVRCPGCMRWEAWKMLCGNLFGLLGLPLAMTQLIRSYRSRVEKGPLRGLDDANRLANRGKIERALDRYDLLMDNLPINAGIKFNIGSGLLKKDDAPHAESMFLLALEDCANYEPALYGLAECYRRLGKTKKLAEIEFQLGGDEL